MGTAHKYNRAVMALGILLACSRCAFALDPSLDISQYAHTAWKVRDGFSKGNIETIAQTLDGYLWLGTEFGLLRFDGVRNVPWQPPAGQHLPSSHIRSLLVARNGRLWIGTDGGLASWSDGKLTQYPELAGLGIAALLEDHEGTLWAGTAGSSSGRICAVQSGGAQCYGEDGSLGHYVLSLYEDSRGTLWAGAETGLWHWKPGTPKRYVVPDAAAGIYGMVEGDNGALLMTTRGGIGQIDNGKLETYPLLRSREQFRPTRLLRDRDGGLWIGTLDRGLLHVFKGRTDVFTQSEGLSGDYVAKLLEDREGNIWVATIDGGLDRFREFTVSTISAKQGLSYPAVWSVLAARDGSVWLGTVNGLNRWKDGLITIYRKRSAQGAKQPGAVSVAHEISDSGLPDDGVHSLFQDDRGEIWVSTLRGIAHFENGRFAPVGAVPGGIVHSMAGDSKQNFWISNRNKGLFHLFQGSVVDRIPWDKMGWKDAATTLAADPFQDGLWLGFAEGGIAYLKDGQVRASYTGTDGLGGGNVMGLQPDRDGTLWAATQGGLSRVKNGHVATLTSKNGLPCDIVNWVMEDDAHSFWLGTGCGLVRIARPQLEAWAADPRRTIEPTVFDSSDGVRSHATSSGFSPRVAKTPDGKIWFLPSDGVSVIDPRHLPVNKLPPPVHIEQITADRQTYWQNWSGDASSRPPRLPPRVRDLEIDYTALSLVAPEKMRFRYKLEDRDGDWQDVGTRRQAFYSDLAPGKYRFRVAGCNNSGVWNEAGDTLDFSIAPAYYQTLWFRLACVAAFLGLLWALYQYRLHQVAQEFNRSLEARVQERTRIARDLHDTLLQSFHGLMLRFQAAYNQMATRPEEARKTLGNAIDEAAEAITESRDTIQGLRSSTMEKNDLALAVRTLGEELASDPTSPNSTAFRVAVEGTPRDLHPILRDEVYRIAGEALRNSFKHAQAHKIEAEIRYDERELRLRVRDDGKGMDPKVLSGDGRSGHFGLGGMRERAKLVGGKLDVWSELDAGTEVELSIPASTAYAASPGRRRLWLTRWRK